VPAVKRPRLFLDVNILLDFALRRPEGYTAAARLLSLHKAQRVVIGLTASTFVHAYYWMVERQKLDEQASKQLLTYLNDSLEVISVDKSLLASAIQHNISDVEDAVQYLAAERFLADAILTRDQDGFTGQAIPALSAEAWLQASPG